MGTYQHNINTKTGKRIKVLENFKYLGSWMQSTEKDIVRKSLAWKSCHKLSKIWNLLFERV